MLIILTRSAVAVLLGSHHKNMPIYNFDQKEEANRSGSALFVIKYVNFYQKLDQVN